MNEFKKVKSREGKFGQKCSRALSDFIRKYPEKYPSDIGELMLICGIHCDFESIKIYGKFHNFLQRHRKYTDEMFTILIQDNWFDKYKTEGLTDEQIYQKFIDACISWEIVPLYYDVDGKYKLIDLHSFLLLKKERLYSAFAEIQHKVESYKTVEKILPDTIHAELEMMKESPDIKKLSDARKDLKYLTK